MKKIILFLSTAFVLCATQVQCANTQEAVVQRSRNFSQYISPGFKTLSGGLLLYWAGDRLWESMGILRNVQKSQARLVSGAKYLAAIMTPVGILGGILFYKGIKGFRDIPIKQKAFQEQK